MADWTSSRTNAHKSIDHALNVVDGLLSYMKDGKGKPAAKERALFAAAIDFIYGVWENYVEQLAIELSKKVSERIEPDKVPELVRKTLEKRSAWELAVSPGWRNLWVENVEVMAVGDDGDKYGLNTAKAGQVTNLLKNAGIDDAFQGIKKSVIPEHLKEDICTPSDAVNRLVELRGEIVHTGSVPDSLRKSHVKDWRQFVEDIAEEMDRVCRKQCKVLLT